jgi:uncharacterized protein involved in exopolysaccharide biosynthesis
MKFSEFESIMISKGYFTLAEISRALDSTPQAVSNWKARDQVPHHIINKIRVKNRGEDSSIKKDHKLYEIKTKDDILSFSDILVTIAEQIKVIVFIPFLAAFITFTYIQFLQQPKYVSTAKVLIPSLINSAGGGFAGIASQFGVNVGETQSKDLSSPSLFPEVLRSRAFGEKLLEKSFLSNKSNKEETLLKILSGEYSNSSASNYEAVISEGISQLATLVDFIPNLSSSISTLEVTTSDPVFSRDLANEVLKELEKWNRYYKNQTAIKKTSFIENRIESVRNELEISEVNLKIFNEKNRQISSPALQLQLDRLTRDVEVQKGIYLTLKQQLELAKIEEIQGSSILQILDRPQISLGPANKNAKIGVPIAAFLGLIIGIALAFLRNYLINSNIDERKKIRRMRTFFNKKIKDIFLDRRISLTVSLLLLICSPFYLGYQSSNPVFLGRYSAKLFVVNLLYVIFIIFSLVIYFKSAKKSNINE